jgi:hypothetical protein
MKAYWGSGGIIIIIFIIIIIIQLKQAEQSVNKIKIYQDTCRR